jgi:hypothetical protein
LYSLSLSLGFGDLVPLANVQRTGQSLYSRWAYFIFTISFILFGLAIMASSLNLLVLRLAQFHSEHGTAGVPPLLGRSEKDLIAAAIAHHRASIHMQQRNRICLNNNNINQQPKPSQSYTLMRMHSWHSASSSSSLSSNSKERNCCSGFFLFNSQKRKRRHWHLRRSPQNIKHLLYFDHLLEKQRLTLLRKPPFPPPPHHHHLTNHISEMNIPKQQRISI